MPVASHAGSMAPFDRSDFIPVLAFSTATGFLNRDRLFPRMRFLHGLGLSFPDIADTISVGALFALTKHACAFAAKPPLCIPVLVAEQHNRNGMCTFEKRM